MVKTTELQKTKSGGSLGTNSSFYKPYGYKPKDEQRKEDTRQVRPYESRK